MIDHVNKKMDCRGRSNLGTLLEKRRDHSPIVTSFFKVMFGKDFSKVLYLPPHFARSVKHLAGQETQIEDSNGSRWPVTFSHVDGSLAFDKGWSKFFADHGLKEGHFLVFNYINGTHFSVRVYGENACETTDFDNVWRRCSKRLKTKLGSISLDEPFQTMNKKSREKPSSSDSVTPQSETRECQSRPLEVSGDAERRRHPTSTYMEDPCLMIDKRDYGCSQERGRDILYDLSCFEVQTQNPPVNELGTQLAGEIIEKTDEASDDKAAAHSHTVKTGRTETAAIITNEINESSCEMFMDEFEKVSDKKLSPSHAVKRDQIKTKAGDSEMAAVEHNGSLRKKVQDGVLESQNGDIRLRTLNSEFRISRSKTVKREYAMTQGCPELVGRRIVKKEQVELNNEGDEKKSAITERSRTFFPMVKVEPDDLLHDVPLGAVSPFSLEVKSHLYLEWPLHIPSAPGRSDNRRKIVYLKDPTGRLWPVLYIDLFTVKALTGNWTKFCEHNSINPGDECRFRFVNDKFCYYRVDIVRSHIL